MTTDPKKTFAAALFATALIAFPGAGLAQAPKPMSDTMSNTMTADCLKKAGMETDSMKRQQMTAECNKGGSMSAAPAAGGAMGDDMMKKDPMKK